jgi:hypothetical protein
VEVPTLEAELIVSDMEELRQVAIKKFGIKLRTGTLLCNDGASVDRIYALTVIVQRRELVAHPTVGRGCWGQRLRQGRRPLFSPALTPLEACMFCAVIQPDMLHI